MDGKAIGCAPSQGVGSLLCSARLSQNRPKPNPLCFSSLVLTLVLTASLRSYMFTSPFLFHLCSSILNHSSSLLSLCSLSPALKTPTTLFHASYLSLSSKATAQTSFISVELRLIHRDTPLLSHRQTDHIECQISVDRYYGGDYPPTDQYAMCV